MPEPWPDSLADAPRPEPRAGAVVRTLQGFGDPRSGTVARPPAQPWPSAVPPWPGLNDNKPASDAEARHGSDAPAAPTPVAAAATATSPQRSSWTTRIMSAAVLLGMLVLLAKLGVVAYYVVTDGFVAPLILSSDSDLVLPSKLNLARLEAERLTLVSRMEQANATVAATTAGIAKLAELQTTVAEGLAWAQNLASESVRSGAKDVSVVEAQRRLIGNRIEAQRAHVQNLGEQLRAGVIRAPDLAREQSVLQEMLVAQLQSERELLESSAQLRNNQLAQRAMKRQAVLHTPEMVQQRDQLIRIDVDRLKLEAEQQTRIAEQRAAAQELVKLDELIAQVKARPVFRAIESQQHVAFVPYTQLAAAVKGAEVYECQVWGIFACEKIGAVLALLPGEVVAQDPWGSPARGQYALLDLARAEGAKAKLLRLRQPGGPLTLSLR